MRPYNRKIRKNGYGFQEENQSTQIKTIHGVDYYLLSLNMQEKYI